MRPQKISWPDKDRWMREFGERVMQNETAKAAYRGLVKDGCIWGNIMSSLYHYTFSPTTVLREHSRRRDSVCEGLKGIAARLERTANAMQDLLDLKWRGEPTFGEFLERRCLMDFEILGPPRVVGQIAPEMALQLPNNLHSYANFLSHLRKELLKKLNPRIVGKSLYLAELVLYVEAATQKPIPWNAIGELINSARPEDWQEKDINSSLLKKNFVSFIRRNEGLCEEIRTDIVEYLAACANLPRKHIPTLSTWRSQRNASRT